MRRLILAIAAIFAVAAAPVQAQVLSGPPSPQTGTGSWVRATSPTLVTPALGSASATTVAIGGATLGSDALAVTGTATISGTVSTGTIVSTGSVNTGSTGGFTAGTTGFLRFGGTRARITSSADGVIDVTNSASTNSVSLTVGASNLLTTNGPLKTLVTTVTLLPAAATVGVGARAFVTDALTPAWGSAVVGGGAVSVPVYSTGSAWNVG
jgi:hypothetical protein